MPLASHEKDRLYFAPPVFERANGPLETRDQYSYGFADVLKIIETPRQCFMQMKHGGAMQPGDASGSCRQVFLITYVALMVPIRVAFDASAITIGSAHARPALP